MIALHMMFSETEVVLELVLPSSVSFYVLLIVVVDCLAEFSKSQNIKMKHKR